MVFKGLVTNKEDVNKLILTPLVRYPLLGGSALITFEKAEGKSQMSAATAKCPGLSTSGPVLCSVPGLGLGALPPCQHYVRLCPPKALAAPCPHDMLRAVARSPELGGSPCPQWPRRS